VHGRVRKVLVHHELAVVRLVEHVSADGRGAAGIEAKRVELDRRGKDRGKGHAGDGLGDTSPIEVTVAELRSRGLRALRR
tara:strand:- start:4500 stop:4739 length:240 start_codon:yes stop_codon:yes gene_type:complete